MTSKIEMKYSKLKRIELAEMKQTKGTTLTIMKIYYMIYSNSSFLHSPVSIDLLLE